MILKALYDLAMAEKLVVDDDFHFKPVSWCINLRPDGTVVDFIDWRVLLNEGQLDKNGNPAKPIWTGTDLSVPVQLYRSGSASQAHFLVDNCKFVFGVGTEKDPCSRSKGVACIEGALAIVGQCAKDTRDPGAIAVRDFLKAAAARMPKANGITLPPELIAGQMFGFRLGGDELLVHNRPAVRKWWKARRAREIEGPDKYECLVTGRKFAVIETFPETSFLPGASKSVKLISFDKGSYASHGWEKNENAPICRHAAVRVAAAFTRLLHPSPLSGDGRKLPKRNLHLPGDVAICYWAVDPSNTETEYLDRFDTLALGKTALRGKASKLSPVVERLYKSIYNGQPVEIEDPSLFYVLTLSGAKGRGTVRSWLETTLEDALNNIAMHHADLKTVRKAKFKDPEKDRGINFYTISESLVALPKGKVTSAATASFFQAALTGAPYPAGIYQKALARNRAEIPKPASDTGSWSRWVKDYRLDNRAAIIKAILNRRRRFNRPAALQYQELSTTMDPLNNSQGYCLGILFAALERLQSAAMGRVVNAPIGSRYFGTISCTPRTALPRLLKGAQHHLAKALKGSDPSSRFVASRCRRIIDAMTTRIGAELPAYLNLNEQGTFVVGYHQMSYWFWMTKDERAVWEAENPEAPLAFVWSKKEEDDEPSDETVGVEDGALAIA